MKQNIVIPVKFISDDRLSYTARLLLCTIHYYKTIHNRDQISIKELSGFLGCSAPTVQYTLSNLEDLGILEIERNIEAGATLTNKYTIQDF